MQIDDSKQARIFELCRKHDAGAFMTPEELQELRDAGFPE